MTAKPPLPDGYQLPERVNGWVHAPGSKKNGHIWRSPGEAAAVGVFGFGGDLHVKVLDERVTGFGRGKYVYETEYDHDKDYIEPADPSAPESTVVECADAAERWMERHAPPWEHPEVESAAFDPPAGYVLDHYYLEERDHVIYYRREDAERVSRLAGAGEPEEYTRGTCPYLYIQVLRGSGNATIALAPWLCAHGPQSKYPELEPVVDPPAECGVAVAVTLAREWVREQTGVEREGRAAGQANLSGWS